MPVTLWQIDNPGESRVMSRRLRPRRFLPPERERESRRRKAERAGPGRRLSQPAPPGPLQHLSLSEIRFEHNGDAIRRARAGAEWSRGIEVKWLGNNPAKATAEELVSHSPDVIVVNGSPGLAAVEQATLAMPVVFIVVTDPSVRASFHASRAPEATSQVSAPSSPR